MIQSDFLSQIGPQFLRFFHIFVFTLLLIHYTQRYHTDQYVILFRIYPSSVTVNIMRIM